jgi:hypothetical protein
MLLVAVVVSSCGSKRKVVSPTNKETADKSAKAVYMEINNLDFHSFSGRAKTNVSFGRESYDFTMNVRIERDKAIWISVTALLGIEAARVLITPDSVKIINKLKGEYIKKDFRYIYRYVSPGVTFATLQDLLLANVSTALIRTDQLTVARSEDGVQLVGVRDELSFQYGLNSERRPRVFRLVPLGTDQSMEALYGGYADTQGYQFPQRQNIKLSAEEMNVEAQMQYNKVQFNEILELPFSVPARYKVIE